MRNTTFRFAFGAFGLLAAAAPASAGLITFDDLGLGHGAIMGSQVPGVTISAVNPARSHDLAVLFDSTRTGTSDPDLQDPWSFGNIAPDTVLGNILIVAENDRGAGDGVLDDPDDQAGRRGQYLRFVFDSALTSFGMDLIDIEGHGSENGGLEYRLGGESVGAVSFSAFEDGGAFAAPGPPVVFGDGSANTLPAITSADLGSVYDEVRITLGGSGAIDNVVFQAVPAPGAFALLVGGLLGTRRRRRRS